MEDRDGTYAPQSPDLSAYNSDYAPEYPQNTYYSQQPQAYHQPTSYQHPSAYLPQNNFDPNQYSAPPLQPVDTYQQVMVRGGHAKRPAEDAEWAPETPARTSTKIGKQPKIEVECDKPAPGIEEGIEVKTKFPVARIKRIMQADEDVGKVAQVTPTAVCKYKLFDLVVVAKSC